MVQEHAHALITQLVRPLAPAVQSIATNGLGDSVSTKLQDWDDAQSWRTAERFDLIVAADCVFGATHEAFATALIGHVPADSETPIIMAY